LVQASGNPLHLEPDQINQILVRVHSRIERVLPLPFACFNNGTMFTYRQLEMVTVIFHLDTAHIRQTLHLIYHVFFQVYGPVSNNNYGSLSFPAIWDSIYEATGNSNGALNSTKWAAVQHQIFRSARAVTRASLVLRGKLT
jgi:hypothetical protein